MTDNVNRAAEKSSFHYYYSWFWFKHHGLCSSRAGSDLTLEQYPERAVFCVFESMLAIIHSDIGMFMIGREFIAK